MFSQSEVNKRNFSVQLKPNYVNESKMFTYAAVFFLSSYSRNLLQAMFNTSQCFDTTSIKNENLIYAYLGLTLVSYLLNKILQDLLKSKVQGCLVILNVPILLKDLHGCLMHFHYTCKKFNVH